MSEIIPGYYIVRLQPGVEPRAFMQQASPGNAPDRVFSLVLNGCSVYLDDTAAAALRNNPRVISVDPVLTADADYAAVVEEFPGWALERISRPEAAGIPLTDKHYERTYSKDGAGVVVYLNDTGDIRNHVDFQHSNIMKGYMAEGVVPSTHGTPVASCIMGKICGVAKYVSIVETVISNSSNVIACFDWIVANHPGGPGIVSLSWSMSPIDANVDAAMQATIDAGFSIVTSAGNYNEDASLRTPASVPDVVTVGGITFDNTKYSGSSWGPSVDIWGPAVSVRAASAIDSEDYVDVTGTSFSAPLAAGTLALVWAENPTWTRKQVEDHVILTLSIKDSITFSDTTQNNNNRLLYIGAQTTGAIHSAYVADYIEVTPIVDMSSSTSLSAIPRITVPSSVQMPASAALSPTSTSIGYSDIGLSASATLDVTVSIRIEFKMTLSGSSAMSIKGVASTSAQSAISSSSYMRMISGVGVKMEASSSVRASGSVVSYGKTGMSAIGSQADISGDAAILGKANMSAGAVVVSDSSVGRYLSIKLLSASRLRASAGSELFFDTTSDMSVSGHIIQVATILDTSKPRVIGENIADYILDWQLKRINSSPGEVIRTR